MSTDSHSKFLEMTQKAHEVADRQYWETYCGVLKEYLSAALSDVQELSQRVAQMNDVPHTGNTAPGLTLDDLWEIIYAMNNSASPKIQFIKKIRMKFTDASGAVLGLRESKDLADAFFRAFRALEKKDILPF